jgi:PilZ domain-containing protein
MSRTRAWIDRAERDQVSVAGSLVLPGRSLPVRITNVSDNGCQIECDDTLPVGAAVSLRLEFVSIAATVRWSMVGRAGLLFVK